MITDEELDAEYRFNILPYSNGKVVKKPLHKPLRSEQRGGFVGLVRWATRIMGEDEFDRVSVWVEQKDDGGKWHQMMHVDVYRRGTDWIRVKGEFPRVII